MSDKSKTLASHGTLDEYIDGLPAYKDQPINSALEAKKVKIGSKWLVLDAYLAAVTTPILEVSEEVEVYQLRNDGFVVTVTVIYGEGETSEFELYSFLQLFKHRSSIDNGLPAVDDTFNDDTPAQTFGEVSDNDMNNIPFASFDIGTSDDKTVTCDSFSIADNTPMRLIGIAGQARAGKDTLASYLWAKLSDDWTKASFADPIKAMLTAIGVDCSDDAKAELDACFGVTPRHMMQALGTEWGRQLIDNDIWVKAFARLNAGKQIIVPDVRFENEADLVREHGVLIHITGRGGIEGSHVSENPIGFKPGDIVIDNSRDLAWMNAQVDGSDVLASMVDG